MENSYGSSIRNPVVDDDDQVQNSQEESGWTAYFQDFSDNNNIDNHCEAKNDLEGMSFSCTSSSLVSDAASYAAWKISDHNSFNTPKKLNFKKTRAKRISEDDSLEDTASSPVNSPKVSDTIYKTKVHTDDLIDNSMGKKGTSSECYSELHPEERMDFNGKSECIDLKKRGLCLVPLSMLVNYIG